MTPGFQQFLAEAAFETQCELRFHGRTEIAEASQGNQGGFHAAVEIAAADVKNSQSIPLAALRH